MNDDEYGVRVADVRVPSWYGLGVYVLILAAVVGTLRKRRGWAEATASLTQGATLLAERMVDGDKRDERIAELTESMAGMTARMESYGRTSVRLSAASLAVAVTALVVAVFVVVAG